MQEIGASRALAIRLGHGSGDELAEGRWTEASELPRPRRGRLDDVEPQSRVAAVLAGRDEVHPAETLMLRARLDAQQGRSAEALYGLRAATAALEERPSRAKQADPPAARGAQGAPRELTGTAGLGRFPEGGLALDLGLALWSFEGLGLGESRPRSGAPAS